MTRLLQYIVAVSIAVAVFVSCRGNADHPTVINGRPVPTAAEAVEALLTEDTVSQWIPGTLDMPSEGCDKLYTYWPGGSYAVVFNDSNYIHYEAAEQHGITPLTDTRSHWKLTRPMVKITSCADYYVEPMKYSRPYLIPEASQMLRDIGRRFRDSLTARGGGDYRIKVTSALRTPATVDRLRRVNRNSVDSSTHLFGTTFDISYVRFICDDSTVRRTSDDLKALLAEILYRMREEGRCFVKYERLQPCFHITCRPKKQ